MNLDRLTRVIDGEPMVSREGIALLFGVTADDIQTEMDRQGVPAGGNPLAGGFVLPRDWIRRGNEISARLHHQYGVTTMADALTVLAIESGLTDRVTAVDLDDRAIAEVIAETKWDADDESTQYRTTRGGES